MSTPEIDLMSPVMVDLISSVKKISLDSTMAVDTLRLILARWDAEGWPPVADIQDQLRKVVKMSDFDRMLAPLPVEV